MTEKSSRAFLIGAGANRSQYPEAPLSADFFKILKTKSRDLHDLQKSVESMVRILNSMSIEPTIEKYNLEELMIEIQNKVNMLDAPHLERIFHNHLYIAIYYLIAQTTGSTISSIRSYISDARSPTIFRNLLTDTKINSRDFFITLNYDLYLDREVIAINQGFIDYGLSKKDISEVKYATDIGRLQMRNGTRIFSVYHLHGSLNWELTTNNKLRVHMLNAVPPRPIRNRKGINVLIVPPGKKTLAGSDQYIQSVWDVSKERLLKEATELIIIGSSLNPQDTELIDLVKNFIDVNGAENVKIIYKKSDEQRKRYIKVLGEGFKEYGEGFDEKSFNFIFL